MKLKTVRVTDFRSIRDSGEFQVGNITCLVGKNEAGKTAVLQALHRLNPLDTPSPFSATDDYPRADVSQYEQDVKEGRRKNATAVSAVFELDAAEQELVAQECGVGALLSPLLTLERGYYDNTLVALPLSEAIACATLVSRAQLPAQLEQALGATPSLSALEAKLKDVEQNEHVARLSGLVSAVKGSNGFGVDVYKRHLKARVPHFLYFDEFYQMRGHENIEELKKRQTAKTLQRSDHPLLGLVALANLTLDDLLNPQRTLELKNRLEGAGNRLSRTILKYWSQNKHIHMRFDVRPARPGDPAGMTTGTNIWAEVFDSKHLATTGVSERSRGFVWFFSFLAWYASQQRTAKPVILLLDEPGLTLHGTAQADLLRYIETDLGKSHQVIYTTHSPFMVDPRHLERVRIVQDRGMEEDNVAPDQDGTKVFQDVLLATPGSLFPLHGALGFEIQQTLFVGPNVLIVEGVSDLLYLQTMTGVLERRRRTGLSDKWIIAPVGGIDKVPAFAALFGPQKGLTVATLIDLQMKDVQTVENLYKRKLLQQSHVLTYAAFVGRTEADCEDMFGESPYLELVSREFKQDLSAPIQVQDLPQGGPRVLPRLERLFETHPLANGTAFNHYRPARYFSENIGALEPSIPDLTLRQFEEVFRRLNAMLT